MAELPHADVLVGTGLARRAASMTALAAVVTVAALSQPASSPEKWVGWWPSTLSVSESMAAWAPSAVAVFAAWTAGQARAHRMQGWVDTSPRSRAQLVAPSLLATSLATLAGQLVSLVALGGASVAFGMTPRAQGLDLLLSVPTMSAYLLVWVGAGVALGLAARREIALVSAAVLPYVAYALLTYASDGPAGALAIGGGRIYDYVRPGTGVLVARLLFWALAASALWAWLLRTRRLRRALLSACLIAAAVALTQGPAIVALAGAEDPVCTGSAPTSCLDASHASTMGRYRKAISLLWPDIPTALRPDVVASSPDVAPARSSRHLLIAPPVAGFTEPARLVDQRMFTARFGDALFLAPCRQRGQVPTAAVELNLWWRITHGVPVDGTAFAGDTDLPLLDPQFPEHLAAAHAFGERPAADRQRWFSAHAQQVADCSATALTDG